MMPFFPNDICFTASASFTIVITNSEFYNGFVPDFEVNYDENSLSFDFLAFNYRDAEHNQYAYKMEGYDEEWIYSGSRRFASYTNLREGTYTFRVKAANNDGIWNEEMGTITHKLTVIKRLN